MEQFLEVKGWIRCYSYNSTTKAKRMVHYKHLPNLKQLHDNYDMWDNFDHLETQLNKLAKLN